MLHIINVPEVNYTSIFISMSIAFNTNETSVINSTFKLKKAILMALMYTCTCTMVIN